MGFLNGSVCVLCFHWVVVIVFIVANVFFSYGQRVLCSSADQCVFALSMCVCLCLLLLLLLCVVVPLRLCVNTLVV